MGRDRPLPVKPYVIERSKRRHGGLYDPNHLRYAGSLFRLVFGRLFLPRVLALPLGVPALTAFVDTLFCSLL